MRFKIDENLPSEAAALLIREGYEADTVGEEQLSGATDEVLAERLHQEDRVLVTLDLDFANIRAYPPEIYAGIVVLRLRMQDKPTALAFIRKLILALQLRSPAGELWIVDRDRIRFRRAE